jgi:hypothetical protein
MRNSAFETVLAAWARNFKGSLSPEVRKSIPLARYDLFFGPALASDCEAPPVDEYGNENEWSGFSFDKACDAIKEACDGIPPQLWLDVEAGYWQELEPEPWECDGETIEVYWESWAHATRTDLRRALLGELAAYVW